MCCLFLQRSGDHRDLPSFPTRRSSDLLVEHGDRRLEVGRYQVGEKSGQLRAGEESLVHDRTTGERTREKARELGSRRGDRKSTRLNSSHITISYAVFCLKKKKNTT